MQRQELTSIDYARLIQFAAQRYHNHYLNKTQIHKILYYVYGCYLALTNKKLFKDDSPQAWPFGPVFPRVNRRVNIDETITFSDAQSEAYNDITALKIVKDAVDRMHNMSAQILTKWSHEVDGPWYRTLYEGQKAGTQRKYGTPIEDELIKSYFHNTR